MQRNGACAGSSVPIFHPRSAACGIIHLTFGFTRADQIVQIPPHRHLGKAGVGGDLLLCHAMAVCWKLQVRREIPCAAGLVPSSRRCKNNQNKCQTPAPWSRPRPSGTGILPSHPCLLEQRGRPAVTCRGGGPSILLTQDRSVAQKPHWGFCCCANASLPWQAEQAHHTTNKEKQSVPDGERPVVHIAIVCGFLQGVSSRAHPFFVFLGKL